MVQEVQKNPSDCIILDNWVFDNFILADKLFAKVLWIFATCLSVSNNLCGKLASSSLELLITFDDNLGVISASFQLILVY